MSASFSASHSAKYGSDRGSSRAELIGPHSSDGSSTDASTSCHCGGAGWDGCSAAEPALPPRLKQLRAALLQDADGHLALRRLIQTDAMSRMVRIAACREGDAAMPTGNTADGCARSQ